MRRFVTTLIATAAAAAAVAIPLQAQAQAGNAEERARLLAGGCTACHGTAGRAQAGGSVLAGMDRAYFISQMQAFKSGQRPATVMHQLAKGYGDADIEALAGYFASQRR